MKIYIETDLEGVTGVFKFAQTREKGTPEFHKYWYDGVEQGEIYQSAVVAGHFDVPVILVTGDEAACREARALLNDDLPTVAVKRGISREAAVLRAPAETRPMLAEGARRAMAALPRRRPLKPAFPVALRVRVLRDQDSTLDQPWFSERESVVRCGLDILRGSPA